MSTNHTEEIISNGSLEELEELKHFLFQESVRIETAKREAKDLQDKVQAEREQFQQEMQSLNSKILLERKRLKEEELFFEKKMDILKGGFAQLETDKKRLQIEREKFETERMIHEKNDSFTMHSTLTQVFFKGVSNPLTLKKRYKDLIKIFHPDNVCGDTDTIQLINQEYEALKEQFDWRKKA